MHIILTNLIITHNDIVISIRTFRPEDLYYVVGRLERHRDFVGRLESFFIFPPEQTKININVYKDLLNSIHDMVGLLEKFSL